MAAKECAVCGKVFESRGNGKLCPDCRVQPCAVCGKPVELDSYRTTQMLKRGWVTCSVQCGGKMGGMSQKGKPHETRKTVVCDICGREFVGKGASKTCDACKTVACAVCGREMHLSGQKLSRYKNLLESGDCRITCGDPLCRSELTKRRLMENEGITSIAQRAEMREVYRQTRLNDSKETKDKRAKSIRDAYADGTVSEKRRRTCRERYGVDSVLSIPDVHDSGVEAARTPESRAKAQETYAESHGGARTPFQEPDIIAQTIEDRNERRRAEADRVRSYIESHPDLPATIIARNLGMKYHTLMSYNRDFGLGVKLHKSAAEHVFAELLDERGIAYERDHGFDDDGRYRYDFWVGGTVIEIDPSYTHNSTHGVRFGGEEGEPKPPSYHRDKSLFAKERGYRCIHIFDWDDMSKIADMFIEKRRIREGGYDVRIIGGMDRQVLEFLDDYHLQGSCKGISFSSCVFEGDSLVGVMSFGKPRFNKKFDLELLRYCVRPDVMVEFGARSMFAEAVIHEPGKSVISYCDMSKFDGGVYERLGFELDGVTEPSPVWFNENTGQMFRNSYVLQRGVDQLLGTSYGKGADNRELMVKEGFVEVYDCGQSRWIKK